MSIDFTIYEDPEPAPTATPTPAPSVSRYPAGPGQKQRQPLSTLDSLEVRRRDFIGEMKRIPSSGGNKENTAKISTNTRMNRFCLDDSDYESERSVSPTRPQGH